VRSTPFRTSGRVSGEDFFGRTEIIRATIRHLRGGGNVAIVGAPRSGQSSLITILFKNYKRAEKDALTWFTDMRELKTLEDLVEEFYIAMGARTESHSLNALAHTIRDFKKRLVFFLDSAERFAEPPFNEEALFAVLSSYLTNQNISFCLASNRPLDEVLTNHIGFPLYSHFIRCDLLPFTPDECYDLIQKKLQFTGVYFDDAEIDGLIEASQGNPADLQQLAAELFKQKVADQELGKIQQTTSSFGKRKR
jgi:hypothetical protein